jgi:hypothetical protein
MFGTDWAQWGWEPGGGAAARETTAGSPKGETPREGANQHHAVEDVEWVDQAGCGVDYDAGEGGLLRCSRGRVQSDFDRSLSTLVARPSTPPTHR